MQLEEEVAALRAENVALREQVQALLARVPRTAPQQEVATWMSSQDSWLKESGSRSVRSEWTSPRHTSAGRTTWHFPLPTHAPSHPPSPPTAIPPPSPP